MSHTLPVLLSEKDTPANLCPTILQCITVFYSEMLNDRLFERLTKFAKVKVVEESTNELRKKQAA